MAAYSTPNRTSTSKKYIFLTDVEDPVPAEEIARLKKELDTVQNANPFRMAEMAIELQIERLRVVEISNARDTALQRLSESYVSIRQKNELLEELQKEIEGRGGLPLELRVSHSNDLAEVRRLKAHIRTVEATSEELQATVARLQAVPPVGPPPSYEADAKRDFVEVEVQTEIQATKGMSDETDIRTIGINEDFKYVPPLTDEPEERVKARNAILAAITLPDSPPDTTLSAIVIPPPFTLHEFLNGAPSPLRTALASYKILHSITTCWCPEREEHGYLYTPLFKCNTNPRIATAHRWSAIDIIGRMSRPTECFYSKEGIWYYAGSYKAFRMDELTTKEWTQLSHETVSAIVKETLAGRKNCSPQNTYETSQLYAVGALKVACVGLQCVGFNQDVYKSILEHSIKFSESKWKSLATASANVLAAAAQANPSTTSSINGSNTPPTPMAPGPTVKTPVAQRHLPRTPSRLGPTISANGSPVSRGSQMQVGTPPALGLCLGSSAWNAAVSGKGTPGIVTAPLSLPHSLPVSGVEAKPKAEGLRKVEGSENLGHNPTSLVSLPSTQYAFGV